MSVAASKARCGVLPASCIPLAVSPAGRALATRDDMASDEAVAVANEIIAALFVTPRHRRCTLEDLASFDSDWWPTNSHRRIAEVVQALTSEGIRIDPEVVAKSAGVAPNFLQSILDGNHADECMWRFRVLREDWERRQWAKTRESIRLACVLGASRQEIRILLDDGEMAT